MEQGWLTPLASEAQAARGLGSTGTQSVQCILVLEGDPAP